MSELDKAFESVRLIPVPRETPAGAYEEVVIKTIAGFRGEGWSFRGTVPGATPDRVWMVFVHYEDPLKKRGQEAERRVREAISWCENWVRVSEAGDCVYNKGAGDVAKQVIQILRGLNL
jgi:hypothetical protein